MKGKSLVRRGVGTGFMPMALNLAESERSNQQHCFEQSQYHIITKTRIRITLSVLLHGGGTCYCSVGIGFKLTLLKGAKNEHS